VVDHDTSPAQLTDVDITDNSATESDSQPPPMEVLGKGRAKKTAKQSVEIIDGSATESDRAPPPKKAKAKIMDKEVEDKKVRKKKESIRDAIEAAQGKVMEGLSHNRPSVDNALKSKLDTKGKRKPPAEKVDLDMTSQLKEPMRFGNGPQWVPKCGDGSKGRDQGGVGNKQTVKACASITGSNYDQIDTDTPAKATRSASSSLHRRC
jgi:hypothetical protein